MQAPTTPSGSPAQEPGERTCPTCGTPNGLTAAFCWQCYHPFGAYRQPPGLAGSPPDRGPWTGGGDPQPTAAWMRVPFQASPPRRGALGRIVGVVLVTLLAVGGAYWWMTRDGSVALPEAFGGLDKVENAQTDILVDTFLGRLDSMGVEGDIAMYGAGIPTAALMWIRDAAAPSTDAAFDQLASGFQSGIGTAGSIDASRTSIDTVDGITYVCAPLVGNVSGTICMWQEREVFWLLLDFSQGSFDAGRGLAQGAHEAVSAS